MTRSPGEICGTHPAQKSWHEACWIGPDSTTSDHAAERARLWRPLCGKNAINRRYCGRWSRTPPASVAISVTAEQAAARCPYAYSQPPLGLIARSMPQIGHVFRVFTMHSQRLSRRGAGDWPRKLADLTASRGAVDLGSVLGFVLERELELGAIGDRPALVEVNVLLDDLGHPQIAERPGSGPDRLRCCVFP